MTRMTEPDCAVMCNLINAHTHAHSYIIRIVSCLRRKWTNDGSTELLFYSIYIEVD